MTYEFIYEFMYMKNIVKSYLNSGVSRFQMSHPRIARDLDKFLILGYPLARIRFLS